MEQRWQRVSICVAVEPNAHDISRGWRTLNAIRYYLPDPSAPYGWKGIMVYSVKIQPDYSIKTMFR